MPEHTFVHLFKTNLTRRKRVTLKNKQVMGSLLYIIAVILIIGWAIGFFAYSAGGLIHILLVIALIAIIVRVIQGRNIV